MSALVPRSLGPVILLFFLCVPAEAALVTLEAVGTVTFVQGTLPIAAAPGSPVTFQYDIEDTTPPDFTDGRSWTGAIKSARLIVGNISLPFPPLCSGRDCAEHSHNPPDSVFDECEYEAFIEGPPYEVYLKLLTTFAQCEIGIDGPAGVPELRGSGSLRFMACSEGPCNNTLLASITTVRRAADVPKTCQLPDIAALAPEAVPYEPLAPPPAVHIPPADSLRPALVQSDMYARVSFMIARLPSMVIQSGYRPPAYQAHFYDLKLKYEAWHNAPPAVQALCSGLKARLEAELYKHKIKRHDKTRIPIVNPPDASGHSAEGGAVAMDVSLPANSVERALFPFVKALAGINNPIPGDDVHFIKKGAAYFSVLGLKNSPLTLTLIDPLGRKVGFDPSTGIAVNEIGSSADDSGHEHELQIVQIANAMPGVYTLQAHSTGSGPYTLELGLYGEHGALITRKTQEGTVEQGETLTLTTIVPNVILIDVKPGNTGSNPINLNAQGNLPVALLSSPDLDVRTVVPTSLKLGRSGTESSLRKCGQPGDVNADGLPDLVCHFYIQALGLQPEDTEIFITGQHPGGTIQGSDFIHIVPK